MASLNKIMIIGNLGKDPEVSYTPSGMAVARFNVATTDYWNDKATGEKKEKTEWHRIVAFAKLGETCGRYLTKGKSVYVEGRLQTTSYEKDGITRYTTDIIASTIQFIGPRGEGGGAPQQGGGSGCQKSGPAYPQNNREQQSAPPKNQGGYTHGPATDFDPYMGDTGFHQPPDDNIPF